MEIDDPEEGKERKKKKCYRDVFYCLKVQDQTHTHWGVLSYILPLQFGAL